MAAELALSLRLPPLCGACLLPGGRMLPDPNSLRRKRISATADSCSSKPERNADRKSHGSVDSPHHNRHQPNQPFLHPLHLFQHRHNQHSHLRPGCVDIGRHPRRPGPGFSFPSQSDDEAEKQAYRSLFFSNAYCSPFPTNGSCTAVNSICTGGGGVDLPFSLRVLKRKQRESALVSGFSVVGNSLLNAFSSVVTVMKTLQSYVLHTRKRFVEKEVGELLDQVQREMHVSFVWLFQQVFACTPELMVLVMLLLADFTTFSVASNLPVIPSPFHTPPISIVSLFSENVKIDKGLKGMFYKSLKTSPSTTDKAVCYDINGGWIGNGGEGTYRIACNGDGGQDPSSSVGKLNKALYSLNDHLSTELSPTSSAASQFVSSDEIGILSSSDIFSGEDVAEPEFSASAAALAFEELARGNVDNSEPVLSEIVDEGHDTSQSGVILKNARNSDHFALDKMALRILVAPLTARIEDDDYVCYDKTDLVYQDAISNDSNNSLLLANYAQFLFLVRKDHERAEELFLKAVLCDPYDCDVMSRFANFLWLARHDFGAAKKAYQVALRADPTNSFHAANYAHFLWNSGL